LYFVYYVGVRVVLTVTLAGPLVGALGTILVRFAAGAAAHRQRGLNPHELQEHRLQEHRLQQHWLQHIGEPGQLEALCGFVVTVAHGVSLLGAIALLVDVSMGARPALGPVSRPFAEADPLAVVVMVPVLVIATTVFAYASRNLVGDNCAPRLFARGSFVVTGTLLVASAARLSTMSVGWLLTSLAVLALLGYRGRTATTRRAALRRTGLAFLFGDLAFLGAVLTVGFVVGDPSLGDLRHSEALLSAQSVTPSGWPKVSAAALTAVLLVIAALVRAGQVPTSRWLARTVEAPTPLSALLHAGVVNAGGIVLVRWGVVLAVSPSANWLLGVAALGTIAVSIATFDVRRDAKGVLAVSTSAQMGFMLLACAMGAPAAAMTHLVGHALYKSARFLGAGDDIRRTTVLRRFAEGPGNASLVRRVACMVFAAGTTIAVMIATEPGVPWRNSWWTLGSAAVAATGVAGWSYGSKDVHSTRLTLVGLVVLGCADAYLGVAAVISHFLEHSVATSQGRWVPTSVGLAGAAIAGAAATLALRHPRTAPRAFVAAAARIEAR